MSKRQGLNDCRNAAGNDLRARLIGRSFDDGQSDKTFLSGTVGGAGHDAHRAIVHLYTPTNPAQREIVFNLSKAQVLEMAVNGTKLIRELTDALPDTQWQLEFSPETFVLTEPIDFGRIPVGDEQITATATGELTLRGVTNPVTFDVTAQTTDGRIGVLGSIPVVFEDYGIDNPSNPGVSLEDEGIVEFVLVFERG